MEKLVVKLAETEKEVKDAKTVRHQVFVIEQGIDSKIQENGDEQCDHFVAYLDNNPVGAGRIRYPKEGLAKIERMAAIKEARGKGIGGRILEEMLEFLRGKDIPEVILESQYHAKVFYEKYGFHQVGDIFEEVGIPHVKMIKQP